MGLNLPFKSTTHVYVLYWRWTLFPVWVFFCTGSVWSCYVVDDYLITRVLIGTSTLWHVQIYYEKYSTELFFRAKVKPEEIALWEGGVGFVISCYHTQVSWVYASIPARAVFGNLSSKYLPHIEWPFGQFGNKSNEFGRIARAQRVQFKWTSSIFFEL